jgi:integrase
MAKRNISTKSDYIDFDRALNVGFKLLKDEKKSIFGLYIIVSLNTGLRVGDVLKIRWSDLSGDKLKLQEQKTNKHRVIQLNDNIKTALSYFNKTEEDDFIFKSQKGSVYSTQQINRLLKQVFFREAKSRNISSHSLRKSMGRRTWEVYNESEKALIYLSELFQHSSTSITRRYLGLRDEELQNVYLKL